MNNKDLVPYSDLDFGDSFVIYGEFRGVEDTTDGGIYMKLNGKFKHIESGQHYSCWDNDCKEMVQKGG